MPDYKTIDIYSSVPDSKLVNTSAKAIGNNHISQAIVRGDKVLFRVHLFAGIGDTTAYALAVGDKVEFMITNQYNASSSEYMVYGDDGSSDPADWTGGSGYDKANGRFSFMVDSNTANLNTDLALLASGRYFFEVIVEPAGGGCDQLTVLQGNIIIKNSVLDVDQTTPITITANPSCLNSSSSSSSSSSSPSSGSFTTDSSSSSSSSESSSSSSTEALTTSVTSSSSSTSFG